MEEIAKRCNDVHSVTLTIQIRDKRAVLDL